MLHLNLFFIWNSGYYILEIIIWYITVYFMIINSPAKIFLLFFVKSQQHLVSKFVRHSSAAMHVQIDLVVIFRDDFNIFICKNSFFIPIMYIFCCKYNTNIIIACTSKEVRCTSSSWLVSPVDLHSTAF